MKVPDGVATDLAQAVARLDRPRQFPAPWEEWYQMQTLMRAFQARAHEFDEVQISEVEEVLINAERGLARVLRRLPQT